IGAGRPQHHSAGDAARLLSKRFFPPIPWSSIVPLKPDLHDHVGTAQRQPDPAAFVAVEAPVGNPFAPLEAAFIDDFGLEKRPGVLATRRSPRIPSESAIPPLPSRAPISSSAIV